MFLSRWTVVSALVLLSSFHAAAQINTPKFERSECAVPVPPSEKRVDCGYVRVPESREHPNRRTIKLPIVILRSDAPDPKPDAVLKTLGGPGASSLRMITARKATPWLRDRDFIIFEQRGTHFADPSLECPEVSDSIADSALKMLPSRDARSAEIDAAKRCYDRLSNSGIDLSAYNSYENAADIDDIRRALAIKKLNLYGVSYSARLMLDVMRYFPKGIRSVVIESTLPPEINYDEIGVDALVRSLDEMFASCKSDAECNKAFPDLKNEFYAVTSRLNKDPLVVDRAKPGSQETVKVGVNGDDFVTWIVDYLFSNEPAATAAAPYAIHQAFLGEYAPQFKRDGGPSLGPSLFSLGMRYSVWCSEERPFERGDVIAAQSTRYSGLKGYEIMALPDICRVWNVRPAKPIANQPVRSSIPTLVFGAEYDSYTDPAWGRRVSSRLKNSFYFEVPWAGHGPGFSVPCVSAMAADFFDDPGKKPDSACLEKTRDQFHFITKNSQ